MEENEEMVRRGRQALNHFWKDEGANEVVTWVLIAALAVVIAVFLFGADPNTLATALGNAVNQIISLIPG